MAQKPQLPPPDSPIAELRTPNPINTFYRELVDRSSARWQGNNPIPRGTLYSDLIGADVRVSKAFPNLYFLTETVPIGSNTVAGMTQDNLVIWNWATEPEAESSYNAEISYLGDAVNNSVFARVYTMRRDEYEASPYILTGQPLTALIGVKMTNGGSSYKHAEAEFDCYGTDAEIEFVISQGEIISAIVIKEGIGFNLGSIINIVGDGSGATCDPIIQPVEAILTSQKKLEFADGDPMSNEFVKVLRVYEILPGPWVPFTRYDDDLGPIQGRRRAVLNTGQLGGVITATGKRNYEGRDGSSIVSIEIEENFSNGTGIPGPGGPNPVYPILVWSTYSDERGTVAHSSQIIASLFTGANATFFRPAAGKIVKTWFEPYPDNPFLQKKFTEAWTEVVIDDAKITSEFGGGLLAVTERTDEPGAQSNDQGIEVVSSVLRTKSPHEQTKYNEFLFGGGPWPILSGFHTDEVTGIVINYTKQYVDVGIAAPARLPAPCRGPFEEMTTYDKWRSIQIVSSIDPSTLPQPETWFTTRPFNLPPTLLSVEAIWSNFVGKTASSFEDGGETHVSVHSGSKAGVIVRSQNGFSGHARTRVRREYFACRPADGSIVQPRIILPSSGSVVITDTDADTSRTRNDNNLGPTTLSQSGATSNAGGSTGDNFSSQVHAIDIRDHLVGDPVLGDSPPIPTRAPGKFLVLNSTHTSQGVSSFATPASGAGNKIGIVAFGTPSKIDVQIPPSTPPNFGLGEDIITEVELTEWRFGVWVLTTYTVINPYAT